MNRGDVTLDVTDGTENRGNRRGREGFRDGK